MKAVVWNLIPLKSVGFLTFGGSAQKIIKHFGFKKLPSDYETATWVTYEDEKDGTRVTVENGLVASVVCSSNIHLQGVNLIGLSIDRVREIFGSEDESEKGIGEEDALYYNRLGLTLWFKQEIVVGATCVGEE